MTSPPPSEAGAAAGPPPPLPGAGYAPPDGPPAIVHVDAQLLAVDKPAGLLSVPGKGAALADCLLARVQAAFPEALLVHRLDRDTSGLIVFALTASAQRHLGLQFERRQMAKTYIARVHGRVEGREGVVDLPLAVDWPNRPRQHVDRTNGRAAVTRWKVLRHEADGTTRMRLSPETGRSHQLRVHMRELGHPIVGDSLYGPEGGDGAARLMLHSESLRLRHPDGGRGLRLRCPCPF
ncbi:MAG: RluA family pseudouridine synthase [Rhodobacteraceae bacterium]|nr:RluA family pseudouridine synthase [Paracoccaceae bacterium]